MGINNRQRRAAKAQRRATKRSRRSASNGPHGPGFRRGERADEPLFTHREHTRVLIELAADASRRGEHGDVTRALDLLVATDPALVDRESERLLLALLGLLWDNGWQPAEAIRHAARTDARAGRVAAAAVAADHFHR